MSQNAERARVIKRIRMLSEQTVERGQSEAHATLAMEHVQKLLTTYNLSMDDVMIGLENCVSIQVGTGFTKRRPIDSVVVAIAAFTDCKTWFSRRGTTIRRDAQGQPVWNKSANRWHRNPGDSLYTFFGFESDALMAQHLFNIIKDAMDTEVAAFKKSDIYKNSERKTSMAESFGRGMASRIAGRLNDMKSQMVSEMRAAQTTGGDLVLTKKNRVEEEFLTTGTTLRKAHSGGGARHTGGFSAGYSAGDRVNLNRPLGGGTGGEQLLLR